MGCGSSTPAVKGEAYKAAHSQPQEQSQQQQPGTNAQRFAAIRDNFESIEEVQSALRSAGLESSDLIIAIDLTKSNDFAGRNSFQGAALCRMITMRDS